MSLVARLEKLETRINELVPEESTIDSPILYKRDSSGTAYYHIKEDNKWVWVTEEDLDQHLKKFRDTEGPIIFMPVKSSGFLVLYKL